MSLNICTSQSTGQAMSAAAIKMRFRPGQRCRVGPRFMQ